MSTEAVGGASGPWFGVVGGGTLRWNGTSVTPVATNTVATFTAFSGTSANDVWAVASTDGVFHWNGTTWVLNRGPVFGTSDVWAVSPSEVWALGQNVAWRLTNGTWAPVTAPDAWMNRVVLPRAGELMVVGDDGAVLRGRVR
jgi:hypothetical protein